MGEKTLDGSRLISKQPYFGSIRASKKQMQREDRINWGQSIIKKIKQKFPE